MSETTETQAAAGRRSNFALHCLGVLDRNEPNQLLYAAQVALSPRG
jgi:hypothetical protein